MARPSPDPTGADMAGIGIYFAAAVLLPIIGGALLDGALHTSPLFVLVAGSLQMGAPFVATSVLRMAAISAIAILAAFLIGSAPWAALIGVGAAQFIMVAASVRQGLRA